MSKILLLVPCVLAACAIDTGEDVETSSAAGEVTVLDTCATGNNSNARLLYNGSTDSYTRGEGTINNTCECRGWQRDVNDHGEAVADANHPDCRPSTYVTIDWDVWKSTLAWEVEVTSWSLTNGTTECENSTLEVSVLRDTTAGTYELQSTDRRHPHMLPNGRCSGISMGGGGTTDARFKLRARATRGLFEYDHGFETVKITAYGY
jgi:hypothetical protein